MHKLAQLEEGRRYLKFTSKITNDIKKVLRRKGSKLDMDTTESLNATLDLMNPPMAQHVNLTYYCRPIDEGKTKFSSKVKDIHNKNESANLHPIDYNVGVKADTITKRQRIVPTYTD